MKFKNEKHLKRITGTPPMSKAGREMLYLFVILGITFVVAIGLGAGIVWGIIELIKLFF